MFVFGQTEGMDASVEIHCGDWVALVTWRFVLVLSSERILLFRVPDVLTSRGRELGVGNENLSLTVVYCRH